MDLSDILSVEAVRAAPGPSSKKRLLQDVASFCSGLHGVDEQLLFEKMQERELLGSTGMGQGVAIPHARLPELDKVHGAFFALEAPVDFEAVDRQPVDLVFVLLAPEKAGAEHLKALAKVSRIFRDEAMRTKLRSTQDPSALFAILTEPEASKAA